MWRNLTRSDLYNWHWYKEIRTQEERRELYRMLRDAGVPWQTASRVRDWSTPHILSWIRQYMGYPQVSSNNIKRDPVEIPKGESNE